MRHIFAFLFVFSMPAAIEAYANSTAFVDHVFMRTGAKCMTQDIESRGMPVAKGLRIGATASRFELIKLQIYIVCTGMGTARQVGSWVELWDPVYGRYRVAPFKAGGDMVLIVHLEDLEMLLTKSVPTGAEPEEDWTQPEAPKKPIHVKKGGRP